MSANNTHNRADPKLVRGGEKMDGYARGGTGRGGLYHLSDLLPDIAVCNPCWMGD